MDALLFRNEDATLQAKNVTHHEYTGIHVDKENCTWNGYTRTLSLSFNWKDSAVEIWQLTFVFNSQAKARHFCKKVLNIDGAVTRIHGQMQVVDQASKIIKFQQRNNGDHQYANGLDARSFRNLVLENLCPLEEVDIGGGVKQRCMKIPAICAGPQSVSPNYHCPRSQYPCAQCPKKVG